MRHIRTGGRIVRNILWFVDRTGMNGRLYNSWRYAMTEAGLEKCIVTRVNLEREMQESLLERFGTRKAPSWKQDKFEDIRMTIHALIKRYEAHAVVLSSPESLALTDVPIESATLHNLRGSVYWVGEIPCLVMLPMSTWFTFTNVKEIGEKGFNGKDTEAEESDSKPEGETEERSEDEADVFYYEPVLSPTGRFTITCDVGKLSRILTYGRRSPGLESPFHLNWSKGK